MPLDLDVIQARAEKATLGPWHYWIEDADHLSEMPWGIRTSNGHSVLARQMPPDDKDGAFIAAARTDIPALVAELQAARKANDGLYRQAMAKELRAARAVIEAAREICHDDWDDQKRLADAVAAYDQLTEEIPDA